MLNIFLFLQVQGAKNIYTSLSEDCKLTFGDNVYALGFVIKIIAPLLFGLNVKVASLNFHTCFTCLIAVITFFASVNPSND
jgi:hypothetical protein